MDPKKLLCAILGLDPATATDDEITAAAEKFGKQEKTEASPDMTALSADVKGLLKRLDEQEKANLLRDAIRAGKLVPQSVRDLPLESFRTVVKDLPENVVPLSARTPENLTALATATPESAATAEVARQLGLDPKSLTEAAA